MIDVKAQTDVFLHPSFVPYIDRKPSIQPTDQIFSSTQHNAWKKMMEPTRPVHAPWFELSKDEDITWKPQGYDVYTSSAGTVGDLAGATSNMKETARTVSSLTNLFLFIVPLSFFKHVPKCTKKYCYDDWVVEKYAKQRDGDGDTKKTLHFFDVPEKLAGRPCPDQRHQGDNEKKKFCITSGFIIYWFALLIIQGGHFKTYKPPAWKL